jgi:hypothetical protein
LSTNQDSEPNDPVEDTSEENSAADDAGSNPVTDKSGWPKTLDDTTDWEVLFENQTTGFVTKVTATQTPEELKQLSKRIIRAVFGRKRDQAIIKKVTTYLDKLIPESAEAERLPTMKAGVRQMLRKVKEDRIKRAALFVAKKQEKKKKSGKKTNRRANPVVSFFKESKIATTALMLFIGAMVPLVIYITSPKAKGPEGDVMEHIRWIDDHVYTHMRQPSWELLSVKKTNSARITIEVLITDPDHITAIQGMKRIARVAILTNVCPKPGSGIEDIINQGWNIWVDLKSPDELLTGGTCHYETKPE